MINTKRYNVDAPIVAFDTETELFWYAEMAPRVVCYSFGWREGGSVRTHLADRHEGGKEIARLLEEAIAGRVVLAGHNLPYDLAVHLRFRPQDWPLVLDALEAGGVHCTLVAEWLIDVANGLLRMEWDEEGEEWKSTKKYGLEDLAIRRLGWQPFKDEWRMRYAELMDVPLSAWPAAAVVYPKKDAESTYLIAEQQRDDAARVLPHDPLRADLAHKCRTYFALHLSSCWGMEIDPERAEDFRYRLETVLDLLADGGEEVAGDPEQVSLIAEGLVYRHTRGKDAGKLSRKEDPLRQLVARVCAERGIEPKMTSGGKSGEPKVKVSADVLADFTDHPVLAAMSDYLECSKHLSVAEKMRLLRFGPIHPRYAMAETGRTTCSGGRKRKGSVWGFNVQQFARTVPELLKGGFGARECFKARPGYVYSSTDYAILEFVTWGQILSDFFPEAPNKVMEAVNLERDPHLQEASIVLNVSYEDAKARLKAGDKEVKKWRQDCKPATYGYPGGMGPPTLVKYAKNQGVHLSLDTAKILKQVFKETWRPEAYFALCSDLTGEGGATIVHPRSDRVHGGMGYTDTCNGFFQGLAADLATDALWRITRECYDERLRSPLLGSRVAAFLHDEHFCEHPVEAAHEAATRVGELMREAEVDWCPALTNPKAEPALSEYWSKEAGDARYDEHGRLITHEEWLRRQGKKAA